MLWSQFLMLVAGATIGSGIGLSVSAVMRGRPWWQVLIVIFVIALVTIVVADSMGGQRIF